MKPRTIAELALVIEQLSERVTELEAKRPLARDDMAEGRYYLVDHDGCTWCYEWADGLFAVAECASAEFSDVSNVRGPMELPQ